MTRKPKSPILTVYVERYLAERELCPMYKTCVRTNCRAVCEFAGRVLLVNQLNCELVNRWIVSLLESGLSPYSVCSYRNNVLAIMNAAYVDRLTDEPPLRVRKVKKGRLLIECYNHDEIRQLLSAASELRGYDANGSKRSDFWQSVIHAGYSSGLRRGDLLSVPQSLVADDGLYICIQHKTGYPTTVRFSADTLRHAAKLQSNRGRLIDWPYRLDAFTVAFRRVRDHAGIARGSFRWLRRAAGSYAEAQVPGAGAKLLGHRDPGVFKRHYEDASISQVSAIEPPPIVLPTIAPPDEKKQRDDNAA